MSTNATLKADKRTDAGKGVARKLRASGRIPAVVYGQGDEGLLLSVDALETSNLFNHISVENTIVDLEVEGEKKAIPTLVREVQVHPFKPDILHVDFYKIQKGVAVEVNVPFHLHGTAPGVKNHGGILQQPHHDLTLRCIPSKIPDEIVFDVSGLEIGDQVLAGQLELPEGVSLDLDPDIVLAQVTAPKAIALDEEEEELLPDTEEPETEVIGEEAASDEE